jgi:glycogen operon protein
MGRTQSGNNNVYAQDSEIAWMDWSLAGKNAGLLGFTAGVVALRAGHPVFRRRRFFAGKPINRARGTEGRTALPDIAWFTPAGEEMTEQDWDSGFGKCVTVFLNGQGITEVDSRGDVVTDDSFLLCMNAHDEDIEVTLPPAEYGTGWAIVVDTAVGEVMTLESAPGRVAAEPPTVAGGASVPITARSVVVLQRTETARS